MAEKPKWFDYIYRKYEHAGLGAVIVFERGKIQLETENCLETHDIALAKAEDDIYRDIEGLEFLEGHPKTPRKWRSWDASGKKYF